MLDILNKDREMLQPLNKDSQTDTPQDSVKLGVEYHTAVMFHILRYLLKRRTVGWTKSMKLKFKGQDTEFYHVQYVNRLELTVRIVRYTTSYGFVVRNTRRITPPRYASASFVKIVLDSYPPLNDYLVVAAPDGRSYSVWVRADAVDEAIRWLISTIQKYAPHYLDKIYMLTDDVTYYAYLTFMRQMEGDNFKNS
jgi:hypothetical protein